MADVATETRVKVFQMTDLKIDSDGEGTFRAAFANMDAIDHDGEGYDPGAIGVQKVKLSVWNHGSWGSGASALPVGVGETSEEKRDGVLWAVIKGEFDLERESGVEHYKALKYFNDKGHVVEWSFALPETEYRFAEREGRSVLIYTKITIPEVSPVLMGAGIDTHLLSIKERTMETKKDPDEPIQFAKQLDEAVEAVERVTSRAKEIQNLRKDKGKDTMSKAAVRRLKVLKDAMVDAIVEVDNLLTDPNDELTELVAQIEGEHEDA